MFMVEKCIPTNGTSERHRIPKFQPFAKPSGGLSPGDCPHKKRKKFDVIDAFRKFSVDFWGTVP
jgi:hypothetical protein